MISDPWRYSGQEHSTPTYERKRLDALLKDAVQSRFDAIIVCDASRWSRDNGKSKQGLEILRQAGIRFYAGQTEYNLFRPADTLFLGMAAEINEFTALEQQRKSLLNRIARAKRGIPTSGKMPYGRVFDKSTEKWSIDKEKQAKIQWAAEQYLAGGSLPKLAAALNMAHVSLHETLTKRCGDTWPVRYRSERLAIDETVEMKIPRLLPQATIDAIIDQTQAQKCYFKGTKRHQYLLTRYTFCGECGHTFYGQTNPNGQRFRYYRHPRKQKAPCSLGKAFWVRAHELEPVVMLRLFALAGDKEGLEAAMARAIPDSEKVDALLAQRAELEKELKKVVDGKENIVGAIADGVISNEDAARKMKSFRERQATLQKGIDEIDAQTQDLPTRAVLKKQASLARRTLESIFNSPGRLAKMTFRDKRNLVKRIFAGKDAQGRKLGVYLNKNEAGEVTYQIRGVLGNFEGPMGGGSGGGNDPAALAEQMGVPLEFAENVINKFSPRQPDPLRESRYPSRTCHSAGPGKHPGQARLRKSRRLLFRAQPAPGGGAGNTGVPGHPAGRPGAGGQRPGTRPHPHAADGGPGRGAVGGRRGLRGQRVHEAPALPVRQDLPALPLGLPHRGGRRHLGPSVTGGGPLDRPL